MAGVNGIALFFWIGIALIVQAQLGTTAAGVSLILAAIIGALAENR